MITDFSAACWHFMVFDWWYLQRKTGIFRWTVKKGQIWYINVIWKLTIYVCITVSAWIDMKSHVNEIKSCNFIRFHQMETTHHMMLVNSNIRDVLFSHEIGNHTYINTITHPNQLNDPEELTGLFSSCLNPAGDRQLSEKGISLEAPAMVNNQKAIYCEDKDVYLIIIRPCSVHWGLHPPWYNPRCDCILSTAAAPLNLHCWKKKKKTTD